MPHKNFHQFKAKNNFELGLLMGQEFAEITRANISRASVFTDWQTKVDRAKKFLKFNQDQFPEYVEEIRGYAKGADVPFLDLYTLSLEDEINEELGDKCTTLITNNGKLIAHNEDWGSYSEDKICVIEKTIGKITILELFYYNTLGGNSVSINSNGFVTCINSLDSKKTKLGLSKNIIARWLSGTRDPDADFGKLDELPRAMGYSGNIVNLEGKIWNIEYNSKAAILTYPTAPFVHTNHYLTELKESEANKNITGTFNRYQTATEKIRDKMTREGIEILMNDQTDGKILSIMNERTIAKVIVDIEKKIASIWLRRESKLDFVDYDINFWN